MTTGMRPLPTTVAGRTATAATAAVGRNHHRIMMTALMAGVQPTVQPMGDAVVTMASEVAVGEAAMAGEVEAVDTAVDTAVGGTATVHLHHTITAALHR